MTWPPPPPPDAAPAPSPGEVEGAAAPAGTVSPRRVVVSVASVAAVGVLPVFLTGGMGVQVRDDLGMSASGLGVVVTAFFLGGALTSARLGRLAEEIGASRSMRIAAVGSAVLLAGAAAAPVWWALAAVLLLAGAANALAQPSSNSLLVDGVPARRRAFAFGIKQSAIPAATLAGGLAVPTVALTVGWRWAFAAAAVLAVAAAWRVPRLRPAGSPGARPAGRVALERHLLLLAVAAGSGAAAANCIGAFVTSSAVEAGFAASVAGLLQAGGSALGLSVRVVTGWVADRRVRDARLVVAAMLALGTVGIALLATGDRTLFAPGVALAFGAGWAWPGLLNFFIADRYQHAPAHATGVTQTGVYVGGAISPLVFGLLAEHVSLAAAWGSVAAFMGLAAAAVVLSGRLLD